MGCNSHPRSCQAPNTHHPSARGATTNLGPAEHPTAPTAPHHGAQQPSWILSGAQQHPSPHNCLGATTALGAVKACNSTYDPSPWGATTNLGPARHSTAPLAPQLPGLLSGTQQLPSQHTTGCNSHPTAPTPTHHGVQQQSLVLSGTKRPMSRGATGALGPARSPTAPTTLQLPVRHPTAPITPHHEVQQPSWILSGSQQHPSLYSARCNNRPGSYQVHSTHRPTPRGVTTAPGSCQAHDRPPSPHTTGCNNSPRILSGTQQHPPPHTTGCNHRPGSRQAHYGTHPSSYIMGCKTILDPARCPPAPPALQLPGFLPGTE